jgi:hypothetical protein
VDGSIGVGFTDEERWMGPSGWGSQMRKGGWVHRGGVHR